MRIIGGRFRGRTIAAPARGARPTTDRTREAIFNLLHARFEIDDARVLDLFAGSGALGLEALSRGAGHATFVDDSGAAITTIRKNAAELGLTDRSTIIRSDAFRYLRASPGGPYDLVFADAPYALPGLETIPDLVRDFVTIDALLVLEHDRDLVFDHHPGHLTTRLYGRTAVSLIEPSLPPPTSPAEAT